MNKQQKVLIESIIKQNPKYIGNENLLEQFCAEVYKKSYLLLDSVSNMDSLKNYLTKVVDTSINSIVKSNISQITLNKESQQQEKELPRRICVRINHAAGFHCRCAALSGTFITAAGGNIQTGSDNYRKNND